MKTQYNSPMFTRTLHASVLALVTLGLSSLVNAQDLDNAKDLEEIEEVMVTGSYIRSLATDQASPVEVIDNEYIRQSGAFTISELTAKLSANSGAEFQADSFTAGETQGTSNVNLRGLGLSSTLVLINGKRQTIAATRANDGSVFVDNNTVPVAALERIEIFKEGATATYGSDAVAGVVNYILKTDFDGFEVNAGYQTTAKDNQDSIEASFLWGFGNDSTRGLISGSIYRQDPLVGSQRPYLVDNAISTLGRSFLLLGPDVVTSGDYAGTYGAYENVPDPNCEANNGILIPQAYGSRCGFAYGPLYNLVNKEERDQLYGNFVHEFSDTLALTAELGYTVTEVLDNLQSPSYPNLKFPVIWPGQGGSPFNVPVVWLGRPLGSDYPAIIAPRKSETWRGVVGLEGQFNDNWHWNGSVTYSSNDRHITQTDTIASRLSAGLAGVGGPNGDETFSVFDSSVNSQEMIDYMTVDTKTNRQTELTVFDFVTSGDLFDMSAGAVGFAAGFQYRREGYSEKRNPIYTQHIDPVTGNTIPVDLIFLGGGLPVDQDRDAYAIFAEMLLPLTESLELTIAARYEDLDTDTKLSPKVGLRWQAADSLVLRASYSTAFREPSLAQFYAQETSLNGIQDFNPDGTPKGGAVFIGVNAAGNLNLKPEESTNYNFGVIWSPVDSFEMRLDYWRFEYDNVITVENAQGKLIEDLNGPDIIRLAGDNSQLVGINTNYFNAAYVDTDGLDLGASYAFDTSSAGEFGVQFTGTHFFSYEIATADGETRDVAGYFNNDNFARSIPKTKLNLNFNWSLGNNTAAVMYYYVSSYKINGPIPANESATIGSWAPVDLQYAYNLQLDNSEAVFSLGVKNVLDERPPVVYDGVNFSYDAKQADPRGRILYARIKYRF